MQLRNYQNGKTVTPHADTLNTMAKNFRDRIDGGGVLTVDMLINDEVSVVQFCGALKLKPEIADEAICRGALLQNGPCADFRMSSELEAGRIFRQFRGFYKVYRLHDPWNDKPRVLSMPLWVRRPVKNGGNSWQIASSMSVPAIVPGDVKSFAYLGVSTHGRDYVDWRFTQQPDAGDMFAARQDSIDLKVGNEFSKGGHSQRLGWLMTLSQGKRRDIFSRPVVMRMVNPDVRPTIDQGLNFLLEAEVMRPGREADEIVDLLRSYSADQDGTC